MKLGERRCFPGGFLGRGSSIWQQGAESEVDEWRRMNDESDFSSVRRDATGQSAVLYAFIKSRYITHNISLIRRNCRDMWPGHPAGRTQLSVRRRGPSGRAWPHDPSSNQAILQSRLQYATCRELFSACYLCLSHFAVQVDLLWICVHCAENWWLLFYWKMDPLNITYCETVQKENDHKSVDTQRR